MKNPILYFVLLVLGISLNFDPDASYKQYKFSKTLSKKELEFVPNRKNNIVAFNLGLMLLLPKINLIAEKKNCKMHVFISHDTSCIEMILALLTEVVTFYIYIFIIQVEVSSLGGSIFR